MGPVRPARRDGLGRELAAREGLPSAVVAQAWLDRDDAETVLAAHGADPLVRGIRHKPRAAAARTRSRPGAPGSMGDPAWRRGYAMLAPNGLSFDLQTPWWHLPEARDLADAFADTMIILNHTGLPSDRCAEGLRWLARGLAALAGAPNAPSRSRASASRGRPWTVEANRGVVLDAIEIFGAGRAMFASNFPVDSLVADFETIFAGFDAITADLSEAERDGAVLGQRPADLSPLTGVSVGPWPGFVVAGRTTEGRLVRYSATL